MEEVDLLLQVRVCGSGPKLAAEMEAKQKDIL
jgi:hypothetical protein